MLEGFLQRSAQPGGINPMSEQAIGLVRILEAENLTRPQVKLHIEHELHAGMYARTMYAKAGTLITGALIKVPTLLIIHGEAFIYIGEDEPLRVTGHTRLRAAAGRKQVFVAASDMVLTMIFPTSAKTVEEAEDEFTDEAHLLQSRREP